MKIELRLVNDNGEQEVKLYDYENIEQAAYFMGLIQIGMQFNGQKYVMENHFLDLETNTVIANCITQKAADELLARELAKHQASEEFMQTHLSPPFRSNEGGGCGGCGGGNCH